MRRILLILVTLAACGDNIKGTPQDGGPVDSPPDSTDPQRLTGCLDSDSNGVVAPNGSLPCDLVPPGLVL